MVDPLTRTLRETFVPASELVRAFAYGLDPKSDRRLREKIHHRAEKELIDAMVKEERRQEREARQEEAQFEQEVEEVNHLFAEKRKDKIRAELASIYWKRRKEKTHWNHAVYRCRHCEYQHIIRKDPGERFPKSVSCPRCTNYLRFLRFHFF